MKTRAAIWSIDDVLLDDLYSDRKWFVRTGTKTRVVWVCDEYGARADRSHYPLHFGFAARI